MKNLLSTILLSLLIVSCGTEAKFNETIKTYHVPGSCHGEEWVDIDFEQALELMQEERASVYDANGKSWVYYPATETFSNGYVAVTEDALQYFNWHICLPK